ncbi:MAG TPA: 50S ribosomal protein L10 [Clostridiales bacterium]|nr:50S ribosomal protein L10 [Clostridiales bacterium]
MRAAEDFFIYNEEVKYLANPNIIEQKAKHVAEIAEKIRKAQSIVIFDYRGLTVSEVTELRSNMRKANVEYVVLKNSMVERAAQEAGLDPKINEMLKGPSAFAFGYDDPVAPAKILKEAVKKFKKCAIKGGVVDGVINDAASIEVLADMPSREQLIARMLGSLMGPITKLAIVLDALSKKMAEGQGAAEAAE